MYVVRCVRAAGAKFVKKARHGRTIMIFNLENMVKYSFINGICIGLNLEVQKKLQKKWENVESVLFTFLFPKSRAFFFKMLPPPSKSPRGFWLHPLQKGIRGIKFRNESCKFFSNFFGSLKNKFSNIAESYPKSFYITGTAFMNGCITGKCFQTTFRW